MSVEIEVREQIARLRFAAPPLNVLTAELQELARAKTAELAKRSEINLLVIESGLPHVFSAGADIREHLGREACAHMLRAAHGLIEELLQFPAPTLCAVQGRCLGGAFELALACDTVLAAGDATMGLPEIRLGCYPPAALVLAPMRLPPFLCAELILRGEVHTAYELARRGAGFAVASESGLSEALARQETGYRGLSGAVLRETVRLLRPGAAERFRAAVGGIEVDYLERLLAMPDATEGVQAFLEKRSPRWCGGESGGERERE